MTCTHRGLRTFTITAAIALFAATASAQTPPQPPAHEHGAPPHAAPAVDVTARMALLDERIAMLTADMKMFVGEMKIQTMAALIEALVERQALADRTMRRMHDAMHERMMNHGMPPPPEDAAPEESPETMCSPFI
jgi:hypothetical protein